MFGGKFNHEARFFADGYELSGVDNVTFSYNNTANILKPLGTKDGLTTHSGPTRQTLSVSRVLTYNDPIFSYTGEAPISGSIFYEDNYYGFETGYLVDYSLNCAVGAVPRVSCNFQVASQMKSGVNANLAPQSHPVIDIPTQGSISITCDNSTTNRVVGFDYGVKCERKAYLTIGSDDIVKVELLPPLEYNATVQLDVDDAFLQDAYKFLEEKENKTLSLNVNGRSGSLIQSVDIPNASLVGEDLQVSADGSTRITLKYIGHSAAYEETTLYGDVTYLFDENGAIYDQTGSAQLPVSWYEGDPNIYGIQLGSNVTEVGEIGFRDCPNLGGDLYIDMDSGSGPTVSSIGYYAFTNCTGFNGNLIIEEGLERIEYAAFKNTSFDGNLILPDSLAQISGEAFMDCGNFDGILKLPTEELALAYNCFKSCVGFRGDLVIPDKIDKLVPYGAFHYCQFDGNLYLGTGIEYIEGFAFYDCNKLKGDLTMPINLTGIGDAAFNGCSEFDGKLTLNPSLNNIGQSAFARCSQLSQNLEIPDSVTGIQDYAFQSCSGINGLTIGDNLEFIGDYAFKFCNSLAGEIDFKDVKVIGRSAFENNDNIGSVKFDSIESIGVFAFRDCDGLNGDLFLPDTLTSLQDRAFALCRNLDGNLTISNSLTEIPYRAFIKCGFTGDLNMGNNIEWVHQEAFTNCKFTNELILPDTLSGISYRGFYGGAFTGDLVLKSNIKQIYGQAFNRSRNIKRVIVDFPETVFINGNHFLDGGIDVGGACLYANARDYDGYVARSVNGLFGGIPICRGAIESRVYRASDDFVLQDEGADIPGTWYNIDDSNADGNPEVYIDIGTGASVIGAYAFGNNVYIKGDINIPSNVKKISNGAFQGASEIDGNLYLNEGLEYIEEFAFRYCGKIKGDIVIPDSVTGIERQVFLDCSGLDGTLTIGRGLKEFAGYDNLGNRNAANYLFQDCSNLTGNLFIPSNIISGSAGTFERCSGFDSLTFEGNNIKLLGDYMFKNCKGIRNPISIPDSVTYIGAGCFHFCENIPSVELGAAVEVIGSSAFDSCIGLDSITLRDNITSVGNNAFFKCSGIQYAYIDVPETAIGDAESLKFQAGDTSDKILFVSEQHYPGYRDAWTTAKGGFTQGYYQGNLISIWPENQRTTIYYDQNFTSLDTEDGDIIDGWKENDVNGHYLYIGNKTESIGYRALRHASQTSNLGGTLLLPSSLKNIGTEAFVRAKITNIASQEGLQVIGVDAFALCNSLTDVILPSTLTSIGARAFQSCLKIRNVTIGSNSAASRKTIIEEKAFYPIQGADNLVTDGVVNIGFSVDQVGNYAFADNADNAAYRWIKTLNCSARYIGQYAFKWQRNLSNLNLTDKCEHIANYAFDQCSSLTSVVIPDPNIVDQYAFDYCPNINNIEIGKEDGVIDGDLRQYSFKRIGGNVTNGSLKINKTIANLGYEAFRANTSYKWIQSADLNCATIGYAAFADHANMTELTFGSGVKNIGVGNGGLLAQSFYQCYGLTGVTIPDPENIWYYSFQQCDSITGVYIGNNTEVTNGRVEEGAFRDLGSAAQGNAGNGHVYVGSSIQRLGNASFYGDKSWLYSADINCGEIAYQCFENQINLKELTLSSGVKSIAGRAFYGNFALTGVKIPDPAFIADYAFQYTYGITGTVHVGNDTEDTKGVIDIHGFRYMGPAAAAVGTIDLYVGSSIESIGSNSFDAYLNSTYPYYFNNIKSADLNCREIGFQAFIYQQNMTGVTFGSGVKVIGKDVDEGQSFYQCYGLTEVRIPDPEIINYFSFDYCSSITGVYIGNDTKDTQGIVNNEAFRRLGATAQGAAGNGYLYIGTSIQDVKYRAFYGDYNWIYKADINARWLRDRAFQEQRNLTEVNLGNSVKLIEVDCFDLCINLKDVTIGRWVLQVGGGAFNNSAITGDLRFQAGNASRDRTLKIYYDAFGGANNKPKDVYLNGDYWDGVSATTSDSWVDFRAGGWPVNMSGAFYVTGDGWTIGESAGPNGKPVRQWTTYPNFV
tara:strand:- start:3644 stop:9682 length:6039 start_codon:yes stop_codon:yes gene_type:complete